MMKVFEAKSYRVKGISFHPTKPWILTSLHNGLINLYDYINGILLYSFEDHDGPVRSIDFHATQPIFASGGDDTKIKIWSYQVKKCMFTLDGHTDYLRTVQFHHEFPWLLSASDDQTIRIWNWQNRTLLTTATGHDHYVMSAFFHPSQNLIVSASLDQTIRIWDYSNLRKKYFEAKSTGLNVIEMDCVMKHKLEGHERGVNWAVFHPTFNLVASGSDDKTARVFKFSDTRWDEVDCFRGHSNNVSSVLFHPNQDYLITVSEDKTFKIWDLTKKTTVFQDKRENERFWIAIAHRTSNIFAFGSDNGLVINKLENSRIPCALLSNNTMVFYNKHAFHVLKDSEQGPIMIREAKEHFKSVKPFKAQIKYLLNNPFLNTPSNNTGMINYGVLIQSIENPDKSQMIYYLLKKETSFKTYNGIEQNLDCSSFCFVTKNKLAVFDNKNPYMVICETTNLSNCMTYDFGITNGDLVDSIHQATQGKVILKMKNYLVCLLDLNLKKIIHETNEITDFKFIVWNSHMTHAAIVGQHIITIVNKNMEICHKIKENSSIKSAVFDENNVLFYSTYFHIKYSLVNGLSGIVKSTDYTYYLMMVSNSNIFYSDCRSERESMKFNYSEIRFNLALNNKNYDEIVHYLKTGKITGVKAIENLKNSGFPDLSLKFVSDPKQKFVLALKSGKLEEAKEVADELKEKAYYNKLAEKAMLMGKLNIVEYCYIKSQNIDKLMFFYLLSGNFDKLRRLGEKLKGNAENSRRFINNIYLANHEEKVNILVENKNNSLALLAAKIYQNSEIEESLDNVSKFNQDDYDKLEKEVKPIVQIKPVIDSKNTEYHSNWTTTVEIKKNENNDFDNLMNQEQTQENTGFNIQETNTKQNELNFGYSNNNNEETAVKKEASKKKILNKWGDDEEEEEEIEPEPETNNKNTQINIIDLTVKEEEAYKALFKNSDIIGIQASIGNFSSVKSMLQTQLGIININPVKNILKEIYLSSYSQLRLIPGGNSLDITLKNINIKRDSIEGLKLPPNTSVTIKRLNNMLDNAFEFIDNKEMDSARESFTKILQYSIFVIPNNSEERNEIISIVNICTEYLYMIKLNTLADEKRADKFTYSQICLLITLCKLSKPIHLYFMLKRAKIATKNVKNYITSVGVIYRLLALESSLKDFEDLGFDKLLSEYNTLKERGNEKDYPFNIKELENKNAREVIDASSLELIDLKDKSICCPLCNAKYSDNMNGKICCICGLTTLGREVTGIKFKDEFN